MVRGRSLVVRVRQALSPHCTDEKTEGQRGMRLPRVTQLSPLGEGLEGRPLDSGLEVFMEPGRWQGHENRKTRPQGSQMRPGLRGPQEANPDP